MHHKYSAQYTPLMVCVIVFTELILKGREVLFYGNEFDFITSAN